MKKFLKIILLFILIISISFLFYMFFNHIRSTDNCEEIDKNIPVENKKLEEPKEVPKDSSFSMSVVGDIMCHNTQYKDAYTSSNNSYDFSYVFDDIKEDISSADIAIGNLETTFAGSKRGYSNYPRFNTPENLAYDLKEFGIDVLSTANNHSMDTNFSGVVSTLDYLDDAKIDHMGTYRNQEEQDKILVKDVNGIKVAFLAFTYGTNGISIPDSKPFAVNLIDDDLIIKQINLAKKENPDLICVSMHWGIEYQTKQNKEQERLANLLFKNGVDVILGSHPHVLQPMEKRTIALDDGSTKDCFIIYSLGNFMSGQTQKNTRNSIILKLDFTKHGASGKTTIDSASYVPIYMYKSLNGKSKRYKIINIEKTLANSQNKSLCDTLKIELERIKNIMGENIIF